MKHKKHFKRSFKPFCNLCGFQRINRAKWRFKNGLKLCRYCHEDFLLFGVPPSEFTVLPDPKIEKHALIHLEKPCVRTGITSPFSPRKKSEETISGGLVSTPFLQSVPSVAPKNR